MNFTKGEWKLESCPAGGKILVRENCAQTHLQIIPTADAQLIAAAPDLYEAVKMCCQGQKGWVDVMHKALAKVEGKE